MIPAREAGGREREIPCRPLRRLDFCCATIPRLRFAPPGAFTLSARSAGSLNLCHQIRIGGSKSGDKSSFPTCEDAEGLGAFENINQVRGAQPKGWTLNYLN